MSEIELKLEVPPDAADRLLSQPWLACGSMQPQRELSVYFDTPDGALRGRGYTLRVRSVGDRFIQTVKSLDTAAGLFERGEWECDVDGPEPDPARLASTPLEEIDTDRLQPVVRTQVERRACRLKQPGAEIEVDVDDGLLTASGRQLPVHEIEIELLRGKASAAVSLARKIAAQVPVKLGVLSKAERGFALADGAIGNAIKAEPVPVTAEMSVARGFETIVTACIRHFRRNESLVIERRSAEALHQTRVAMRRLRSAFSLFRTAIEDPEFERLRGELRWFTDSLGEARNLDVYLERELSDEDRAPLQEKREAAYGVAIAAMESARFRGLMLDLVAWAALGEWRKGVRARQPLRVYADRRIDRWWSKVSETRRPGRMDDMQRHRLRIRIKKLRYALEFVRPLHVQHGGRRRRFRKRLEAVQESLGKVHDSVVARSMIASGVPGIIPTRPKQERKAVRKADRAVRRLRQASPYWTSSV
jgi:inorganic triphosphatase YgiF